MDYDHRFSKKKHHQEDGRGTHSYQTKKMNIVAPDTKEQTKSKHHHNIVDPHLHLLKKYDKYNWESQDSESLYASFKELEKALKIMVEVVFIFSPSKYID